MAKEICNWTENYECMWDTDCNHTYEISNEGTPSENRMAYCCYCGKMLVSVRYVEASLIIGKMKEVPNG
jgi:hypothetical protein